MAAQALGFFDVKGNLQAATCWGKGGEVRGYLTPYAGTYTDPRPWLDPDGVVMHPEDYSVWCVQREHPGSYVHVIEPFGA